MEKILTDGTVDVLAMARPLIREPDLPNKMQRDESKRARCVNCNGCLMLEFRGKAVRCVKEKE